MIMYIRDRNNVIRDERHVNVADVELWVDAVDDKNHFVQIRASLGLRGFAYLLLGGKHDPNALIDAFSDVADLGQWFWYWFESRGLKNDGSAYEAIRDEIQAKLKATADRFGLEYVED